MSMFLAEYPKVSIGVAVCVGIGTAAGFAYYYRKKLQNTPPKKWRKVGELTELFCFPIKSAGCIRLDSLNCSEIGLQNEILRDRIFMVVRTNGEFITGRIYPKMVQILPKVEGETMTLSAPGMLDLKFNIQRLYSLEPIKANVWSQLVSVVDAGEDAARWFSRYLLSEDFGLRLVLYQPTKATRDIREKNKVFTKTAKSDTGALHDATSFMLVNESSVSDLNTRLEKPVTPLQFRPNFVIRGPKPFEEDSFDWIRIGSQAIFRNVKPCTRCIFTNVDPETAERNVDEQPLKTLKEYRTLENISGGPVLGIHMGLRVPGQVNLGDSIYIGCDSHN